MKIVNRYTKLLSVLCALLLLSGTAFGGGQADRRSDNIQHEGTRQTLWEIRHGMEPTAAGGTPHEERGQPTDRRRNMEDRTTRRDDRNMAYEIKRSMYGGNGPR